MSKHLTPFVLAAAVVNLAVAAPAFEPALAQLDDAALETRFWDCDSQATLEALPVADGALCVMASDELKRRRFGGDFAALLAWWQDHKAAEHARRSAPAPNAEDLALQTP